MDKDFLKKSNKINDYLKVLFRLSNYSPFYNNKYSREYNFVKKNNKHFKVGGNKEPKKKKSLFDFYVFSELFTVDLPIKLKFTKSKEFNNINVNNETEKFFFEKLTKEYDDIGKIMDNKNKYPEELFEKVVYEFEIFKDKRFKKELIDDYGFKITQAGIKMNEMIVAFKDLIPKKKVVKTFHICEAPGNFIKMIKFYVETILKGTLDYNASSLNDKDEDVIKKFGKIPVVPTKNSNKWHFGKDNTGDVTKIENIKSLAKYCKDVDLITSDCGLGENTRDEHSAKLLFYSSLFMLMNVPEGKNCLLKFYLPLRTDIEISIIYNMYKYFDKTYFFKPVVNFRSGEFYLVCLGKKKVPEKVIRELSAENPKYEKVDDVAFLLQLYNFSKRIIEKRTKQLERLIYLMDNYDLLTKKEFHLINKIRQKRIKHWMKVNKLV